MRMGPRCGSRRSSATQLDAQVVRELSVGAEGREDPAQRRRARPARRRDHRPGARLRADRAVPRRPDGHRGDGQRRSTASTSSATGKLELTDAQFFSEQHVLRVIDRIVAPLGRRIDEASPMVDARLPDGSRVNAVIPPLAIDGPQLTIRKFTQRVLTLERPRASSGTLTRPGRRLPRRVRAGPHEHPDQRRHRQRQDHAAQRAVVDDPRRTSAS